MSALLVALSLLAWEPARTADFEAAPGTSYPERYSLCVAAHPSRPLEVDLCSGFDKGVTALVGHLFARKTWGRELSAGRGFTVALGLGAGGRVNSFCRYGACALAFGPEALASLEGVFWLTPSLGLTLQLDGGVAVTWTQVLAGLWEYGFRFPVRLLFGVAL